MTAGDQFGSCGGDPAAAVARAFREERAAVLATLIRQAGDFQLAEDALQDAFADAITAWQRDGIPANPGAWITVAARRRTIDRLRRDRSLADRAGRLAELARLGAGEDRGAGGDATIADDRLRQAAITALHVQPGGTDTAGWAQVAELYGALAKFSPSPVVEVNRATAAGFAYGPEAGLQLLGPLLAAPALQRYQPLHAAHAELLRRAGRRADAIDAYRRAIELSGNSVERAELERRLRALTSG